ncbi:MAG TPA: sugar phosphate isomerase/epimerase [Solirubrobacteraceae bacterium]
MRVQISAAPGTWGVESPCDPANPPWRRLLSEIADIGFEGTELGPLGYLPDTSDVLARELASRSLSLVAGFLMEPFHEPARRGAIVEVAERTCRLLRDAGARRLVLMEALVPSRMSGAGRSDEAPRLDDARWRRMVAAVEEVVHVAVGHGLQTTFHPHAGTYVEFVDEIEHLMADLDDAIGLCLDTGHCVYAGIDPVEMLCTYGSRVRHLHVKDADEDVLARCLADGMGFADAVAAGVFCALGRGDVDFGAFCEGLRAIGYEGWATVEQDRLPNAGRPRVDAEASLEHLRRVGIASRSLVVGGGSS